MKFLNYFHLFFPQFQNDSGSFSQQEPHTVFLPTAKDGLHESPSSRGNGKGNWQCYNKKQVHHSESSTLTMASNKSHGGAFNAASRSGVSKSNGQSSHGKWNQFVSKSSRHDDDGESEVITEKSVTSPKPSFSGKWDKFESKSSCCDNDGENIQKNVGKTVKSASPKLSVSSTTATSSKWGQFLDTSECVEQSSEEFWPQDETQQNSLMMNQGQESCNQGYVANDEFKSNDDQWMPDDNSQISSCGSSFQDTVVDRSSKQIYERHSIGEQKVDSLQGSSRWNVFLANESNESCVESTPLGKTQGSLDQTNCYTMSKTESENRPTLRNGNERDQGEYSNMPNVKPEVNGNLFSIEEHDIDEIFSDDW